jgi:integrase
MASLRTRTLKDGTTSYTVLFRADDAHGERRQTSETFDNAADATEFMTLLDRHGPEAARRILDARDGHADAPMTVVELVHRHIDALSGVTVGTRRRYHDVAKRLDGHALGALPARGVSRADITAWVRDLEEEGLAGKTISFRHQLLAAAYKRAVLDELLPRNPATGVKIPRTERRPMDFMTPAEFMTIYAVVPTEWKPLVHTLAATGLRISEALALVAGDLHLDGTRPRIDVARTWQWTGSVTNRRTGAPKTERGRRSVSIGPALVSQLAEHVAGKAASDWVFPKPGADDGQPPTASEVSGRWRRWVEKSGLGKKPRLHSLRHSHVAWMLDDGQTLDRIKQRLGHSSIKITVDTYGHILPDALDEMAAASDRALLGLPAPAEQRQVES